MIGILFSGCATVQTVVDSCKIQQEKLKALDGIVVADGIDLKEATILASNYFRSSCGGIQSGQDAGDQWSFPTVSGYGGILMEDKIYVNKSSGAVSLKGQPTENIDQIKMQIAKAYGCNQPK